MAYIDLNELESGRLEQWPLFSSKTRYALLSVLSRDHMCNEPLSKPLQMRVRDVVERESGKRPGGRICLLTNLRVLGVEFNPVSFYYVFDELDTQVETLVVEVSNFPWFEQHNYMIQPVDDARLACGKTELRRFSRHEKEFHVSPFIGMEGMEYDWLVSLPAERVQVQVGLRGNGEGGVFRAGLDATRVEWSWRSLMWMQVMHPLHTLLVMGGILYEAGKLFRKGFTFFPHPAGTQTCLSRIVERAVDAVHNLAKISGRIRRWTLR